VPYNLQGVEPERCPSFSNALKHNKPVYTNTTASIADGLLVPTVGVNAFATGGKVKVLIRNSN
jgi:threonine dehydratase